MPSMNKLSTYRTTFELGPHGGSVTYIRTRIVAWTSAGTVTLNSDNWRTVTTKRKMTQASNQFGLGYTVSQRRGTWFVTVFGRSPEGHPTTSPEHGAVTFLYHDGITFNPHTIRANAILATLPLTA